MKTIKTPEEFFENKIQNCHNCNSIFNTQDYITYSDAVEIAKDYHAQFTVTDEEFDKAKAKFVHKLGKITEWGGIFSDLDSLLEMKAGREMPTEEVNYMHVIEQTEEEEIAMYMKQSKEDIIKMLLECQRLLKSFYGNAKISSEPDISPEAPAEKKVNGMNNFTFTISDTYCTYEYPLNISNMNSVDSIAKKIFKVFHLKEKSGRLLK